MRIIERGLPPEDKEYEYRCANCRTKFAFKASEATKTYGDQRDPYTALNISCPVCHKTCTQYLTRGYHNDR